MSKELKPCPFCGGEAVFIVRANKSSHYSVGFSFEIECSDCGLKLPQMFITDFSLTEHGEINLLTDERGKAITAWNNRTDKA